MIGISPTACLAATLVALAGGGRLVASDDLVVEPLAVAEPEETVRFLPVDGHGLVVPGNRLADYDLAAVFDQHVFRRPVGPRQVRMIHDRIVIDGAGESSKDGTLGRLAGLRRLAERRIATLERVCGLSAHQREILSLAVESDVRRLAGDIDATRRRYAGQRSPAGGVDRELLQRVRDDAEACRQRIDQFGRSGTLLGSVSLGLLDARQRAVFTDWVAGRRASRWEAMVRTVLAQFDETVLGLSESQHDALLERLLADVPPLVVLDDTPVGTGPGRAVDFQAMLVAGRLQQLEHADLRPRFDPRQWAVLEQVGSQYGAAQEIEMLLVEQGLLEETQ